MGKTQVRYQSGRSWRLLTTDIPGPDGAPVEKAFIDHPGAVVLVPILDGQLLMLRQYRLALDKTVLELPAGTRGWDEPWLACAQRELREETGYRSGELTPLGEVWPAPGVSNELMRFYLARDLTPDPLPADFDEQIALAPMPLADLVTLALNGGIQDGKSVVGILRAAWAIKQRDVKGETGR